MDIVHNSDGSVTVTCGGDKATIHPTQPGPGPSAGPDPKPPPDPGTVSTFYVNCSLGPFGDAGELARHLAGWRNVPGVRFPERDGWRLVLHAGHSIDVTQIRKALADAGLGDTAIEIVPVRTQRHA